VTDDDDTGESETIRPAERSTILAGQKQKGRPAPKITVREIRWKKRFGSSNIHYHHLSCINHSPNSLNHSRGNRSARKRKTGNNRTKEQNRKKNNIWRSI
jgi:hypothetical protein